MQISKFLKLISQGFDVSFNYKDVFYTISLIYDDGKERKYGIGSDNGFAADFPSLDSIPSYVLDDKTIEEIVNALSENDIYY